MRPVARGGTVGVYSGTYIVANGIQAFYERKGESAQFPKFVGSSVANVSLSVMKDKAFARMFGTGEAKPLPFRSYGAVPEHTNPRDTRSAHGTRHMTSVADTQVNL